MLCDLSNKKKLFDLLQNRKFHYVVNLGGYVDHSKSLKTFNSHYKGCKNLSDALLNNRNEILRFIQIGSSLEYGKLKSPHKENLKTRLKNLQSIYSKSKLMATNYLMQIFKEKKFPIVIFRIYLTYGPYQDYNRLIPIVTSNCLNNKSFATSSGLQKRDFIYIDDVIKILIKSLTIKNIEGEIFNLGTGKPVKVKSLIIKIKKIIKKGKPNFGNLPLRKDEQLLTYPNISKLKKFFKFNKFVSLSHGLKKTINFYKKSGI